MFFKKTVLLCGIASVIFFADAKDKTEFSDPLQQRAKSGDIAAQLELGKEYFKGVNRPLNRALALYYFKLAADAGSPEGMFNLGMCYEYGVEYKISRHQAFYWYSKAGDFVPALFKKALFLENGIPSEKKITFIQTGNSCR